MIKKRIISTFIFVVFVLSIFAFDLLRVKESSASELGLSLPNQIVDLSKPANELKLSGINVNPQNLLDVSFYFSGELKNKDEATKLVEYFLTAMSFEGENLWVNLSPYEKDRVLDERLAQTQLGKVLLKQDYLLKQLSSSLTNPDTKLGQEYWKNKEANDSAFNKIWIAADKAVVGEDGDLAMIEQSSMNVFTEADYLAMQKNTVEVDSSSSFIKEKIVPLIKDDVNAGSNFSELRQVYSALILAKWFKDKYFNSVYSHYIDSAKVKGVDTSDPAVKKKVFELYSKSFKDGVYNQIKKVKADNGSLKKKNYVSGGITPNPDSKMKRKKLDREKFDGQTMASGVALFDPILKSGSVVKMLAMTGMLLLTPILGKFSQTFASDYETSSTYISERSTRAPEFTTEYLDSLINIAQDLTQTENDRLIAMTRMSADQELNYSYYNALYSIFEDSNETVDIRKRALTVIAQMKDVRAYDGFKIFIDSHSIATTASLSQTQLQLLDHSLTSFAEWSDMMNYYGLFSDRVSVMNTILPYADANLNDVQSLRWEAWYALGYLPNNTETEVITQLEEMKARDVAANHAQAQQAIDQALARNPVEVKYNYLVRYPNQVVDWSVDSVHTHMLDISQNTGDILYQTPYVVEAIQILGAGVYADFDFGDGNQKDSLSYKVLDSLDQNRALMRSRSEGEQEQIQEAIDSAKAEIWDRLNPISVINNNLVPQNRFSPQFVQKVDLRQAINLQFPASIQVYDLRGRIVAQVEAPRGHFQLDRANLGLARGMYMLMVNYNFGHGPRSSVSTSQAETMFAANFSADATAARSTATAQQESDDNSQMPLPNPDSDMPTPHETVLASRRYDYDEEVESEDEGDEAEASERILVVDRKSAQPEKAVSAEEIVDHFFAAINSSGNKDYADAVTMRYVDKLDEAGDDMVPVAYVKHGGIDMDLEIEVSSSAIKDKLYATMSPEQVAEHKAQSRFLAGFTFEFNMNKGKMTIDDIIAQKK